VGHLTESDILSRFVQPLAGPIDDDVAWLEEDRLLVTSDCLVEGVHFRPDHPPFELGAKAILVNLSDIIASGGRPEAMTLSLALPSPVESAWVEGFFAGVQAQLEQTGTILIGGDTTASRGPRFIAVTLLGRLARPRPILRSDARPGDLLAVTGRLGESAYGLWCLERGIDAPQFIRQHHMPELPLEFGRGLEGIEPFGAMMDLSDGLTTDLPRLCTASGVGARVELDRVPIPRLDPAHSEMLWHGGEDYQLLFSCPPSQWPILTKLAERSQTRLTRIGEIVTGDGPTYVLGGRPYRFQSKPWAHFRDPKR